MGAISPSLRPETTLATCGQIEWHLSLPGRHYLHIAARVAELFVLIVAAWLMMQRTRATQDNVPGRL
jgi:hypothetical protein